MPVINKAIQEAVTEIHLNGFEYELQHKVGYPLEITKDGKTWRIALGEIAQLGGVPFDLANLLAHLNNENVKTFTEAYLGKDITGEPVRGPDFYRDMLDRSPLWVDTV